MSIETLIWFAIALGTGALVWLAEPYHTRLIQAAHARDQAGQSSRAQP